MSPLRWRDLCKVLNCEIALKYPGTLEVMELQLKAWLCAKGAPLHNEKHSYNEHFSRDCRQDLVVSKCAAAG